MLLAEVITGKSYKDDEETSALGMMLLMGKNEWVKDEMDVRDDTWYSSPYSRSVRILGELDFEEIFTEEFDGHHSHMETYKIFWRNGALVTLESYTQAGGEDKDKHVNSASLYANWLPLDGLERAWEFTSTGHWNHMTPTYDDVEGDPWVWIGHWDLRTGLRDTLDRLYGNGKILPEWVEKPLLHLCNFGAEKVDHKEKDWMNAYDVREKARFDAVLPEHVKKAIAGKIDPHRKMHSSGS